MQGYMSNDPWGPIKGIAALLIVVAFFSIVSFIVNNFWYIVGAIVVGIFVIVLIFQENIRDIFR